MLMYRLRKCWKGITIRNTRNMETMHDTILRSLNKQGVTSPPQLWVWGNWPIRLPTISPSAICDYFNLVFCNAWVICSTVIVFCTMYTFIQYISFYLKEMELGGIVLWLLWFISFPQIDLQIRKEKAHVPRLHFPTGGELSEPKSDWETHGSILACGNHDRNALHVCQEEWEYRSCASNNCLIANMKK